MSRIEIVIIIYHRHKPIEPESKANHSNPFNDGVKSAGSFISILSTLLHYMELRKIYRYFEMPINL
jgi:hypothetical protein